MTDTHTHSQPEYPASAVSKVRQILATIEKNTGVKVGLLDAGGTPADFDAQARFQPLEGRGALASDLVTIAQKDPKPILHGDSSGAYAVSVPFLSGGHIVGFVRGAGVCLEGFDGEQTEAVKRRVIVDSGLASCPSSTSGVRLDFGRFCVLLDLLEAAAARIGLFVASSPADGSLRAIGAPFSPEIMSVLEDIPRISMSSRDGEADIKVRERLEALYNSTQEAIVMLDATHRIVTANKEFGTVFGLDADSFVGASGDWLRRWMIKNAKDPSHVAATIDDLLSNRDSVLEDEIEFLSPRYMILRFYSAPVADKGGQHIGRVLVFRDITKFRKARYDLIGSEKTNLIGRVAAGMAHELNNILAGMVTYADYALEDGSPDKIREALRMSIAAADKASELVGRFLAVAGPSESHRQDVDIHTELERLLDSMEPSLKADNIRVHRLLEAVPRVFADPVQIQQAFHHVLDNAREAIGKDGTISVRTETDWDRGNVRVIVTDTGPGIPAEYLDRIFDPFFTTKGVVAGGGSTVSKGLGLSVAKGIVEAHGGRIYAGNVLPRGASIIVELPLTAPEGRKGTDASAY